MAATEDTLFDRFCEKVMEELDFEGHSVLLQLLNQRGRKMMAKFLQIPENTSRDEAELMKEIEEKIEANKEEERFQEGNEDENEDEEENDEKGRDGNEMENDVRKLYEPDEEMSKGLKSIMPSHLQDKKKDLHMEKRYRKKMMEEYPRMSWISQRMNVEDQAKCFNWKSQKREEAGLRKIQMAIADATNLTWIAYDEIIQAGCLGKGEKFLKEKAHSHIGKTIMTAMTLQAHSYRVVQRQRKINACFAITGQPLEQEINPDAVPLFSTEEMEELSKALKLKKAMLEAANTIKGANRGRGRIKRGRGRTQPNTQRAPVTDNGGRMWNKENQPWRSNTSRGRGLHVGRGSRDK